jgi:hypothetical protein
MQYRGMLRVVRCEQGIRELDALDRMRTFLGLDT